MSSSTSDRRALARAAHRRAHVRRQLGQFFGRLLHAIGHRLAGMAEAELDQRLVGCQVLVGRPLRKHADEQREQRRTARPWPIQASAPARCFVLSHGRRPRPPRLRLRGLQCATQLRAVPAADASSSPTSAQAVARHVARHRRRAVAARALPRQALGGPALAEAVLAAAFAAAADQHRRAPSRSAYSTKDGGSAPMHIRLSGSTSGAGQRFHPGAMLAAEDDDLLRRFDAARPWRSRSRSAPMGACGMSMPVTSSATLRKGVDDGQAPTQMPQLAHRSASTAPSGGRCGRWDAAPSSPRHRGNRRSSAGSHCSWRDRPRPPGCRATAGQNGSRPATATAPSPARPRRCPARWRKPADEWPAAASRGQRGSGTCDASAGAWLITGRSSASRAAPRTAPQPVRAAGTPRLG